MFDCTKQRDTYGLATRPSEGSVSWGTLRPTDLLRDFASELQSYRVTRDSLAAEAEDLVNEWSDSTADHELAYILLHEMADSLNDIAEQHGMYFGAHEGDGAAFGFWIIDEEEF